MRSGWAPRLRWFATIRATARGAHRRRRLSPRSWVGTDTPPLRSESGTRPRRTRWAPLGPFDRWPTHEGFDHFYGFMGAEMDHWNPLLYDGTLPVEPARHSPRPYHLTEDLIDHATRWIELHQGLEHERPFFLYLAPGACHSPLHVARPWREKYRGRFEHGWDEQRHITLARAEAPGHRSRRRPVGAVARGRAPVVGTDLAGSVRSPSPSWRPSPDSPNTPTPRSDA